MKVAIFGGTGFIGSYIVDALVAQGHQPRVLVREGSEHKLRQAAACVPVSGDIGDENAVRETLSGVEAAIYLIGRRYSTRPAMRAEVAGRRRPDRRNTRTSKVQGLYEDTAGEQGV